MSPREPLVRGVRQAALTCIDEARAQWGQVSIDPVRSIHGARIGLKQLRALLRLPPRPRPAWIESARREAAACARYLALYRDRDVAIAVCREILDRHPRRWKAVLGRLAQPAAARPTMPAPVRVASLDARLAQLRCLLATHAWPPLAHAPMLDSLRRAYRRARKTHAFAAFRPTAAVVHEWRKAVVLLRNQLDLVAPNLTGPTRKFRRKLHALARRLGAIGDLTVAERRIAAPKPSPEHRLLQDEVLAWIGRERTLIVARTLARSATLFRAPPRKFADRLSADSRR